MVHENTKILTVFDKCVFCVCMLHTITKMCYPCNIQRFFSALKNEEKNLVVYTLEPPRRYVNTKMTCCGQNVKKNQQQQNLPKH